LTNKRPVLWVPYLVSPWKIKRARRKTMKGILTTCAIKWCNRTLQPVATLNYARRNVLSIFLKIVHQKGLFDAMKQNSNSRSCRQVLHIWLQGLLITYTSLLLSLMQFWWIKVPQMFGSYITVIDSVIWFGCLQELCNLLSFLVHYFFLCSFSWILTESVYMRTWDTENGPKKKYWIAYFLLGWGESVNSTKTVVVLFQ